MQTKRLHEKMFRNTYYEHHRTNDVVDSNDEQIRYVTPGNIHR